MTAKECLTERRSIRKFKPDAIDHALIDSIVKTASFSPSWKNTQVVRYIAIEGELKDKIADAGTESWPNNGVIIKNAPMLIAVTIIPKRSGFERDGSYTTDLKDGWQIFDAGIASQSFCLAAHEEGLGTVILGIFDRQIISSMLNLNDDRELIALIPVGYPDEAPVAPKRKDVSELVSYITD